MSRGKRVWGKLVQRKPEKKKEPKPKEPDKESKPKKEEAPKTKKHKTIRKAIIGVRVTPFELEQIEQNAVLNGYDYVSEFVRDISISGKFPAVKA